MADYHNDGFLVVEDFADADTCAAMVDAANRIAADFVPAQRPTVFTTGASRQAANREFLDSAANVTCFYEEGAFTETGELAQDQVRSINKIGHALHDLEPAFRDFTYSGELAQVASDIGMNQALALQSMYIFKQPHFGGEVTCHQDATFLYTEPMSVVGFWVAMQDATTTNGCLWAQPGGHRSPLRSVFKRTSPSNDDGTIFEQLDTTPWPAAPDDLVALPVSAGSLVILHGLLPHWSDVNRSDRSRHAYSVHCIDGTTDYPAFNWLQRPADMPLRRLDHLVAA